MPPFIGSLKIDDPPSVTSVADEFTQFDLDNKARDAT